MKKFIVFLSSVALFGSVSYAMDEEAMDEEMMMEAAAPSVAVGGSASIGIKNDSSADSSLKLIRAYKVTFDSSGTTDGGLMFGAGISLRDDTTEEDAPTVKGSKVYIGGADGSWKVQFGGNDPGIDLAGGIGLADDHFLMDEEDASISLEGSFGGTSYRLTLSDPSNSVPTRERDKLVEQTVPAVESGKATPYLNAYVDWTKPATVDAPNISGLVLADVDNTAKYMPGGELEHAADWDFSETCGIAERTYYTFPDDGDDDTTNTLVISWDVNGDGDVDTNESLTFAEGQHIPGDIYDVLIKANEDNQNFKKLEAKTTYSRMMVGGDTSLPNCSPNDNGGGPSDKPAMTMNVPTEGMDNGLAVYAARHKQDQWSIGFTHSLDTINIGVGMDSGKGLALGVGTELSGVGLNLYYSKSEQENFKGAVIGGKDVMETQENTGLGVKASMAAGEGATVSVAYSTLKEEKMDSSTTDKKIELDFSYDLGGGATLQASVDKNDPDGGDSNTVLEAKVAMSF